MRCNLLATLLFTASISLGHAKPSISTSSLPTIPNVYKDQISSTNNLTNLASTVPPHDASGCIGNSETQYMQFHGADNDAIYGMFIYADGNFRDIHPGNPDAKCVVVSEGKDQYHCIECNFKMEGMQVMNKGSCWLTILPEPNSGEPIDFFRSSDEGYSEFGQTGYPNTVKCYLDEVDKRNEQDERDTMVDNLSNLLLDEEANPAEAEEQYETPGCASKDNTQLVKWHSGPDLYGMYVPLDGNMHNFTVSSDTPGSVIKRGLRCNAISQKGNPCIICDKKMDHVQIMNPGSCTFRSTTMLGSDAGKHYVYTIDNSVGLGFIGTASYPIWISCKGPDVSGHNVPGLEDFTGTVVLRADERDEAERHDDSKGDQEEGDDDSKRGGGHIGGGHGSKSAAIRILPPGFKQLNDYMRRVTGYNNAHSVVEHGLDPRSAEGEEVPQEKKGGGHGGGGHVSGGAGCPGCSHKNNAIGCRVPALVRSVLDFGRRLVKLVS